MGAKRKSTGIFPRPPARGFDAAKGSATNPFEDKWARRAANAAASRTAAERRAALVAEMRASGRANSFADRRIGEGDPSLPVEDKYLARLQRERSTRAAKRARFNLAEDDDGDREGLGEASFRETGNAAGKPRNPDTSASGFRDFLGLSPSRSTLTHHGHALSNATILRDDYVVQGLDSDDDDHEDQDTTLNPQFEDAPTGGKGRQSATQPADEGLETGNSGFRRVVDEEEHRKRTHKEIMDEVIAKSKSYKAERQQEKAKTDEQTTLLDAQLPEILRMLNTAHQSGSSRSVGTGVPASTDCNALFRDASKNGDCAAEPFDYDKVYIELASEKRAYATDRVKTEEEREAEERSVLEELERLRRHRMTAMDDDDEGNLSRQGRLQGSTRRPGIRGGDDLMDDFECLSANSSGDEADCNTDSADTESFKERKNSCVAECTPSSNENFGIYAELTGCPGVRLLQSTERSTSKRQDSTEISIRRDIWCSPPIVTSILDEAIPFLFSTCPETQEELQELFMGLSCSQRHTVLSRLRKCFAISLNPAVNRPKLKALCSCLLVRIDQAANAASDIPNSGGFVFPGEEIDVLLPHVFELAQVHSDVVVTWARNHIEDAYSALVDNSSKPCADQLGLASRWTPGVLLVLRAISRLFPGSDLRHAILTPLSLMLSFCLSSVPILEVEDMSVACFAGAILLDLLTPAKRFSGELVCFIADALAASSDEHNEHQVVLAYRKQRIPQGLLAGVTAKRAGPLTMSDCLRACEGDDKVSASGVKKARILKAVEALARRALLDGNVKSIREAASPILLALRSKPCLENSAVYKEIIQCCIDEEANRAPLRLYQQAKSAAAPRLLNPKIRSDTSKYRGSANVEMDAQRRLRRRVKTEARSAARELRRDGEIIAAERLRAANDEDSRRATKTAQIQSFMERQQHDAKRQTKVIPVGSEGLAFVGRKRKKW